MMTMIQLTHKGDAGPLLVNPDHIAAITVDSTGGARVHMGITGHQWGVSETPQQVLNLISDADCGSMPPPPPTQGVS